jgi:hypothetical protein
LLAETFEGGKPGEGNSYLDPTRPDGTGNSGVFATLDTLTSEQALDPTPLGLSVAAHAQHLAYYLEVQLRWFSGDEGPYDWKGSFEPSAGPAGWRETRDRLRRAYEAIVSFGRGVTEWDENSEAVLTLSLAHSAYHLGAIRQALKLVL